MSSKCKFRVFNYRVPSGVVCTDPHFSRSRGNFSNSLLGARFISGFSGILRYLWIKILFHRYIKFSMNDSFRAFPVHSDDKTQVIWLPWFPHKLSRILNNLLKSEFSGLCFGRLGLFCLLPSHPRDLVPTVPVGILQNSFVGGYFSKATYIPRTSDEAVRWRISK